MRFWLLVLVVGVASLGLGAAVGWGIDTVRGSPEPAPLAAVSPTTTPTPSGEVPTPTSSPQEAQTPTPTGSGRFPGQFGDGQQFRRGVTGTISQIEGGTLVVDTRQGPVKVALGQDTAIQQVAEAGRDALQEGLQVTATGQRQPDGSLAAVTVVLGGGSPFAFGGGGFGQRALPVLGTISQVQGDTLVVDTPQGTVKVALGPDTAILRFEEAGRDALQQGVGITVRGSRQDDGSVVAATIVIGQFRVSGRSRGP